MLDRFRRLTLWKKIVSTVLIAGTLLTLGMIALVEWTVKKGLYPKTGVHPCEPGTFLNGVVPDECKGKPVPPPSTLSERFKG